MGKVDKIEVARNILYNAARMNMNKEIILKISQKIDQYIVEHFNKNRSQKDILGKEQIGK
ncbi:aspartyl-phosphate phosphatase Spo0E family protein [Carboxydothermus hydrogenoformans]|uniref:Spo0E like sporulation regulatory protein n=1 Tax=Carboxydothermus hydrogenoformans (strain ATCC BAA-161 / DSM 6008 / Z-2901) TaxID=246194 RepID=Q3AB04_CARHZ|nr:aspartyl-phosphate phosphatase Spo0E family protein [Carboxydothermus hydrogenoformans]ABB13984.1 hypothetical protein CHY_1860 [Carboxydothermus hydrogenoformans Z-2901]